MTTLYHNNNNNKFLLQEFLHEQTTQQFFGTKISRDGTPRDGAHGIHTTSKILRTHSGERARTLYYLRLQFFFMPTMYTTTTLHYLPG